MNGDEPHEKNVASDLGESKYMYSDDADGEYIYTKFKDCHNGYTQPMSQFHVGYYLGYAKPKINFLSGYGKPMARKGQVMEGYGHPVDGYGHPVDGYGHPVDGYGHPADGYGHPIDGYGHPIDGYGHPVDGYGHPVDGYGHPVDGYGHPADGYGHPVDGYGQPKNRYGQPMDGYWQPKDRHGQPMDGYLQPKDRHGQPMDGYLQPKDKYGQPRDQLLSGYRQQQNSQFPVGYPIRQLGDSTSVRDSRPAFNKTLNGSLTRLPSSWLRRGQIYGTIRPRQAIFSEWRREKNKCPSKKENVTHNSNVAGETRIINNGGSISAKQGDTKVMNNSGSTSAKQGDTKVLNNDSALTSRQTHLDKVPAAAEVQTNGEKLANFDESPTETKASAVNTQLGHLDDAPIAAEVTSINTKPATEEDNIPSAPLRTSSDVFPEEFGRISMREFNWLMESEDKEINNGKKYQMWTLPLKNSRRSAATGHLYIPEPDYEMDHQNQFNNQIFPPDEDSGYQQSQEKKKSVRFVMNEELAKQIHSTGTMRKKDSILKDAKKSSTETMNRSPAGIILNESSPDGIIVNGSVVISGEAQSLRPPTYSSRMDNAVENNDEVLKKGILGVKHLLEGRTPKKLNNLRDEENHNLPLNPSTLVDGTILNNSLHITNPEDYVDNLATGEDKKQQSLSSSQKSVSNMSVNEYVTRTEDTRTPVSNNMSTSQKYKSTNIQDNPASAHETSERAIDMNNDVSIYKRISQIEGIDESTLKKNRSSLRNIDNISTVERGISERAIDIGNLTLHKEATRIEDKSESLSINISTPKNVSPNNVRDITILEQGALERAIDVDNLSVAESGTNREESFEKSTPSKLTVNNSLCITIEEHDSSERAIDIGNLTIDEPVDQSCDKSDIKNDNIELNAKSSTPKNLLSQNKSPKLVTHRGAQLKHEQNSKQSYTGDTFKWYISEEQKNIRPKAKDLQNQMFKTHLSISHKPMRQAKLNLKAISKQHGNKLPKLVEEELANDELSKHNRSGECEIPTVSLVYSSSVLEKDLPHVISTSNIETKHNMFKDDVPALTLDVDEEEFSSLEDSDANRGNFKRFSFARKSLVVSSRKEQQRKKFPDSLQHRLI